MKNILVINSSLQGENGNSNKAAKLFVDKHYNNQEIKVIELDLNQETLPHLSAQEMQAWSTDEADRNSEQAALASISDRYISLIKKADEVVVAAPMYNFGIPSTLKAFFDRIGRAGVTFSYTEQGPKGLLTGKKAHIISVRGGQYAGTPMDSQLPYLKTFLNFIGISDQHDHLIEGLAMGGNVAKEAWEKFETEIM